MLGLLRTAADEAGQTIVMVTHDPRAASVADRVIFLEDGPGRGRPRGTWTRGTSVETMKTFQEAA